MFFIVLLIFIDHHSASASKPDYQHPSAIYETLSYDDMDDNDAATVNNPKNIFAPESGELASRTPWSQLFHNAYGRSRYYALPKSGFALRRHDARYIPQGKRAIPIELQKALFAHGIVGRRR